MTERGGPMKEVIVRGGTAFKTEISAGPHTFYADEPADAGGTEAGPTPYDFLSAALGAWTSMRVHVVAQRQNRTPREHPGQSVRRRGRRGREQRQRAGAAHPGSGIDDGRRAAARRRR